MPGSGFDVKAENAKAGTRDWRISRTTKSGDIEGWADRASIHVGESVGLAVSTTSPTYEVSVFRMGWYGGALARLVTHIGPKPGHKQAPFTFIQQTRTITTNWPRELTISTRGWAPGDYLFRLEASNGSQHYVPLTVRDVSAVGRLVIVNAVTTWQAYNAWGGYNIYNGPDQAFDTRSYAVSFDRPYDREGAGDFVGAELPALALAERLGLPVAYATDIDLHADLTTLTGATSVITLGHDEYWSTGMRNQVTQARDAGVNVAFLGANAVFRHIRLRDSEVGPNRLEICYKRPGPDPYTTIHPKESTVDWREPPLGMPESTLTGVYYECNPVSAPLVITDPSFWMFAEQQLPAGAQLPKLVGSEYDRVNPGVPTPTGIQVVTHSPVTCRNIPSYSDSSYYTVASGAGVFSTGTSLWVSALDTECGDPNCVAPLATSVPGKKVIDIVTAATAKLFRAFSVGPAAQRYPAMSNLSTINEHRGDPIQTGTHRSTSPDEASTPHPSSSPGFGRPSPSGSPTTSPSHSPAPSAKPSPTPARSPSALPIPAQPR